MQAMLVLRTLVTRGDVPRTRAKDVQTSLKKLADASQLPLEALDLHAIQGTYVSTLRAYFAGLTPPASRATERNTYQNLQQLISRAQAAGLLAAERPAKGRKRQTLEELRRQFIESNPYREHYAGRRAEAYTVPMDQWPEAIRQGWQSYVTEKAFHVRETSLRVHEVYFTIYVGYNLRHETPPLTQWDQLFDPNRIRRCLTWLARRVGVAQISRGGQMVLVTLTDIAKRQKRPDYLALHEILRGLPPVAKMHDKKRPRHTISLVDLDQAGLTLQWEGRQPSTNPRHYSGGRRAVRFQTGLIVRLLVRCPRRSREIREMDFDGRLYHDETTGRWQLYYRSDQLKIAEHFHEPNEFAMEWPDDLVQDLEEYRQTFRPILLKGRSSRLVFPNMHGDPLTDAVLAMRITSECYRLTGKHIWPHLFRTLWCDAYLDAHPGDWEGAAAMLNDTPQTVQSWYRNYRVEQHLKKGVDFNAQLFGNGHTNGQRKGTARTRLG